MNTHPKVDKKNEMEECSKRRDTYELESSTFNEKQLLDQDTVNTENGVLLHKENFETEIDRKSPSESIAKKTHSKRERRDTYNLENSMFELSNNFTGDDITLENCEYVTLQQNRKNKSKNLMLLKSCSTPCLEKKSKKSTKRTKNSKRVDRENSLKQSETKVDDEVHNRTKKQQLNGTEYNTRRTYELDNHNQEMTNGKTSANKTNKKKEYELIILNDDYLEQNKREENSELRNLSTSEMGKNLSIYEIEDSLVESKKSVTSQRSKKLNKTARKSKLSSKTQKEKSNKITNSVPIKLNETFELESSTLLNNDEAGISEFSGQNKIKMKEKATENDKIDREFDKKSAYELNHTELSTSKSFMNVTHRKRYSRKPHLDGSDLTLPLLSINDTELNRTDNDKSTEYGFSSTGFSNNYELFDTSAEKITKKRSPQQIGKRSGAEKILAPSLSSKLSKRTRLSGCGKNKRTQKLSGSQSKNLLECITLPDKNNIDLVTELSDQQINVEVDSPPSSSSTPRRLNKSKVTPLFKATLLKENRSVHFDSAIKSKDHSSVKIIAKNKTSSRIKVPNFTSIHKKNFDSMESIDEYKKRLEERSKLLLSGLKPVNLSSQNNLGIKNVENTQNITAKSSLTTRTTPMKCSKALSKLFSKTSPPKSNTFGTLPKTPLMSLDKYKSIHKPAQSNSPFLRSGTSLNKKLGNALEDKKPTPIKLLRQNPVLHQPRTTSNKQLSTNVDSKMTNKNLKQVNKNLPSNSSEHVNFQVRHKSETKANVLKPVKKDTYVSRVSPKENIQPSSADDMNICIQKKTPKLREGYTRFGFKIASKPTKEEMKAVATKCRVVKDNVKERRDFIKGVRSNRRFDLLMKMRGK